MKALLEAYKVTKTYEKAQHPSLKNVSFTVTAGEFIGIMGASGSGKTTLLNVLSTIDTPSSGDISINGINLKNLNNRRRAAHMDKNKSRQHKFLREYDYLPRKIETKCIAKKRIVCYDTYIAMRGGYTYGYS